MQFTPVTSVAFLREGNYIRFDHEGTTYIGRLISGSLALRAKVKGHPEFTPTIVEKRADAYENISRRLASGITNVESITFEPGDEVEFVYGHRDVTYEGRLYRDGTSTFLRADIAVTPDDYMPNIIDPRTNEIAGAISDLWPINIKELRPAEAQAEAEVDVEMLRARVAELESRLTAQQVDAETRLDTLRSEVGEKAMELAREHGWCEVVDEALRELGIEPPQVETRMSVTVRFDVVATSADPHRDITPEWISNSVIFGLGEEGTIGLDSDWESVAVDSGTVIDVSIGEE